jgi:DNA repair protein RecO (recombination protein O)
MLQKTRGIVLHTLKHRDASSITDIYTEICGRASFVISVSRSKKAGIKPAIFQPLSLIEFEADFSLTSSLYKVTEATLFFPFTTIPYDFFKAGISLFLAEFLYRILREEAEDRRLFDYLIRSIIWLDEAKKKYANFHPVFLINLARFLGLYPDAGNYRKGDYFDMLSAGFTSVRPQVHPFFIYPEEACYLPRLLRMNYETMHLFKMNRMERMRLLTVINEYYRIHFPGLPELKSLKVLQEVFD